MSNNWTVEKIAQAYIVDHPEWSEEERIEQARIIYREITRSRVAISRNDKKYYKHNIPYDAYQQNPAKYKPTWDDVYDNISDGLVDEEIIDDL